MAVNTTPETLARLADLESKATLGPWWVLECHPVTAKSSGGTLHTFGRHEWSVLIGEQRGRVATCITGDVDGKDDSHASRHDSTLIAEMRSALPSLLADIRELQKERRLLAMLAADTPQFFNPLHAMAAKELRDRVLQEQAP